jgi:HSP20 family protein
MQEQVKQQSIPLKVYQAKQRVTIAAAMPGLEPENIAVEVTPDGKLILHGELRGRLKGIKELLLDEWSAGGYHREVPLATPVNATCANVTYGNGVLTVALPLSEQTYPARLTLKRVTPTHGKRRGNAGHPPACLQA